MSIGLEAAFGTKLKGILSERGAVMTDSHFVLTSGLHADSYVNMRRIAHLSTLMRNIGSHMGVKARRLTPYPRVFLGPETLGRTLAEHAAANGSPHELIGIWCNIIDPEDGPKYAEFSPKLEFDRLVAGEEVIIFDDMLTSGSSILATANLVRSCGGNPVTAVVAVDRSNGVSAEDCGVVLLGSLVQVAGFNTYTPEDCITHGPCSERVPMCLRPGHSHEWIKDNPDYPVAK